MTEFAVIFAAGGSSVRFGRDKLWADLLGRPVINRSLDVFLMRPDVKQIVVATRDGTFGNDLLPTDPRLTICTGGSTRAQSVWNALKLVPESIEWVAVHDAARPLVSQAVIDRTLEAAVAHGAAVPALPVALTIKQAAGPLPARVERTIPRHDLWAMQTPQVARRSDLLKAFEDCPIRVGEVTDDVQLIELAGGRVWLVDGDEQNLKITTPTDLALAEILLASREAPTTEFK